VTHFNSPLKSDDTIVELIRPFVWIHCNIRES